MEKLHQSVEYINKNFEISSNKEANNILDEMIKEGLIQRFKYTHELA